MARSDDRGRQEPEFLKEAWAGSAKGCVSATHFVEEGCQQAISVVYP